MATKPIQAIPDTAKGPDPQKNWDEDLSHWWATTTKEDGQRTVPKTIEYGSRGEDLIGIGRKMAQISHMDVPVGVAEEAFYAELGIYFYLVGKVERMGESFKNGRLPSDDCWFDSTIYSLMARRVRAVGHWG